MKHRDHRVEFRGRSVVEDGRARFRTPRLPKRGKYLVFVSFDGPDTTSTVTTPEPSALTGPDHDPGEYVGAGRRPRLGGP